MPSSTTLFELAPPARMKELMQVQSMLSIVLSDEEWLRYFRYTKDWAEGVDLAIIDNGGGNDVYVFFTTDGVVVKGFDHESTVSPHHGDEFMVRPGMYEGLPPHLDELLNDAAIERENVTFCVWRTKADMSWKTGSVQLALNEDDGSEFLLPLTCQGPEEFLDWAEGYYETSLPPDVITKVYATKRVTAEDIRALSPERDVQVALKELKESGLI